MVNLNLLGERAVPYFTATPASQRQTLPTVKASLWNLPSHFQTPNLLL